MNKLTDVSVKELPDLFNQASIQLGFGTSTIIEKDYWLVQILKILYADEKFAKYHVFKGGTSLSKCYRLIRRFSEDLDITIDRSLLNFNETTQDIAALGSKQLKRFFEELFLATNAHVIEIKNLLLEVLNEQYSTLNWSIYADQNDSQSLIVEYPRLLGFSHYPAQAYIKPKIILEFGSRGEVYPSENKNIETYVEQAFSNIFETIPVNINTLHLERTFWEKITLLHMLAHQLDEKTFQTHMARHYYDVYLLYRSDAGKAALKNLELLEQVAQHKSIFFKSKQSSYETAKPGTLLLIPNDLRLQSLAADYLSMKEMFFDEIISFESIIQELKQMEYQLNN